MSVARRIKTPIRVRFEECQPGGEIRASAFLRYAQDAAWVHSDAAGFGRDWYLERGLTWLVRCVELDVLEPSGPGDTLSVSTEVVGLRRVWARRRGEVLGPEGALVAVVLTDWVMTGPGFVPVRVPAEFFKVFPAVPEGFEPARVPLPPTPAEAYLRRFHVRRSEIDPMAHVNNAAYVDYLEESLAEAGAGAALDLRPRRYRLEYQQAAEPGAELVGASWRDGKSWAYRLSDASGVDLLRARFSAAGAIATFPPVSYPARRSP
jgi:acyl-ACP thioesterase